MPFRTTECFRRLGDAFRQSRNPNTFAPLDSGTEALKKNKGHGSESRSLWFPDPLTPLQSFYLQRASDDVHRRREVTITPDLSEKNPLFPDVFGETGRRRRNTPSKAHLPPGAGVIENCTALVPPADAVTSSHRSPTDARLD